MRRIDQILDKHGISPNFWERDRYLDCLFRQHDYHPVCMEIMQLYPYDQIRNCPSLRVIDCVGMDESDLYVRNVDNILHTFPDMRQFLESCDCQFRFEWKSLDRVNSKTMMRLYEIYLSMPAEHLALYRICN